VTATSELARNTLIHGGGGKFSWEVKEKTAENKFGSGFFAKIKASIADFLKTSQPNKH
jgi:hypothetical protein